MPSLRRRLFFALAAFSLPACAGRALATGLDISSEYRMRALSYTNLNLMGQTNNRSFISENARLGVAVKDIHLQSVRGEEVTMDVGMLLHGLGVAGSTSPLPTPFDQIAAQYPNTNFTPFIENAYVKTRGLFGYPTEMTFGQQSFTLGSGLLLSDDGAGLAGWSARNELPWWNMRAEEFLFQGRNSQSVPNSLMLYGAAVELPTDGTWQLNELFERDRAPQMELGYAVSKVVRSFTSLRYQISFGPIFFDGEAAAERGAATPTGLTPAPNHITFKGDAQVIRAKWKQSIAKFGEGIARVVIARGSGQVQDGVTTTDTGFFPSRGHRLDGLERSGFGDFFASTPYDAFGGRSTQTATSLMPGISGVETVGVGFTPPAYHGIILDLDYFLYQADRNNAGSERTLGMEYDFRIRTTIRDRLTLATSAAYFKAGTAINVGHASARRLMFEATGRF